MGVASRLIARFNPQTSENTGAEFGSQRANDRRTLCVTWLFLTQPLQRGIIDNCGRRPSDLLETHA
jgi:hypothetical protein